MEPKSRLKKEAAVAFEDFFELVPLSALSPPSFYLVLLLARASDPGRRARDGRSKGMAMSAGR